MTSGRYRVEMSYILILMNSFVKMQCSFHNFLSLQFVEIFYFILSLLMFSFIVSILIVHLFIIGVLRFTSV